MIYNSICYCSISLKNYIRIDRGSISAFVKTSFRWAIMEHLMESWKYINYVYPIKKAHHWNWLYYEKLYSTNPSLITNKQILTKKLSRAAWNSTSIFAGVSSINIRTSIHWIEMKNINNADRQMSEAPYILWRVNFILNRSIHMSKEW